MEKRMFYTVLDISGALGVHPLTVRRWIQTKRLQGRKIQGRYYVINAEFMRFIGKEQYNALINHKPGGKP